MNFDKYLHIFGWCEEFFFSTLLSNSHSAQNGLLKLEHQGDVLSAAKQLT